MEEKKFQFTFELDHKTFLLNTVVSENKLYGQLYDFNTGKFIYDFDKSVDYGNDFSDAKVQSDIKRFIEEKNWTYKEDTKADNILQIPETCQNKYVFTFGSAEQFPFHLGEYIVIEARNEKEARDMFKVLYPNPRDRDTLNCAFVYENAEFEELRKTYGDFKKSPERLYVTDAYKAALYLEQVYELLDKAQETMSFQCNEKGMDEIGELMGDLDNLMDDYIPVHNPNFEKEEDGLER